MVADLATLGDKKRCEILKMKQLPPQAAKKQNVDNSKKNGRPPCRPGWPWLPCLPPPPPSSPIVSPTWEQFSKIESKEGCPMTLSCQIPVCLVGLLPLFWDNFSYSPSHFQKLASFIVTYLKVIWIVGGLLLTVTNRSTESDIAFPRRWKRSSD